MGGVPVEPITRLITSVGIQPYSENRYRWGQKTVTSGYSATALVRLLGLKGGQGTVLLTEAAAERHWARLQQELAEAGWAADYRLVPEGGTMEEQMAAAELVMDSVRPGEAIVLDVTQGLRHLPFAYLAALTYLVGLQGNRVLGIYYSALELRKQDPAGVVPVFDLSPLFRLLEWYQALGAAEQTGDLRPLTRSLIQDKGWLFRQGLGRHEFGRAADAIQRLARALAMGTPLEVGIEVGRAVAALERLEPAHVPWLPARRMLEWLRAEMAAGRWGKPVAGPAGGESGLRKAQVPLTREELERQLELARWYADRYDFVKTALLLREWLVSAAVWAYGDPARWLSADERKTAEGRLHALQLQLEEGLVRKDQAVLGHVWQRLRIFRNFVAHAGMTVEKVKLTEPEQSAKELLRDCQAALDQVGRPLPWPLPLAGRLVITPLGLKPGLLLTVCRKLQPDRLLIVTSEEAAGMVDGALAVAGCEEVQRRILLLADPFVDKGAPRSLLDDEVREWLASASEVVANITGGTAFMGYVVQQLAHEASRFGRPVRPCVLIDRRPEVVQEAEPYVEGEVHWLQGRGGQGAWEPRHEEPL